MIHYRIIKNDIYEAKIYRSLNAAQKQAKTVKGTIIAFSSKKTAQEMSDIHLVVKGQEPKLLSSKEIACYVKSCDKARSLGNYERRSCDRVRIEKEFDLVLFGFDSNGRAVESRQYMSVSRKWVRFSAPIFINNRKVTKKTLLKAVDEIDLESLENTQKLTLAYPRGIVL
jgi:hypothetical protein